MAKELPYFKFEPNQWENGNIQICTREEKGVFIDLCSMYWSRLGDLPYKLAVQKLCAGNATALDSLYENEIIKIIDGNICIDFLNEQLSGFENVSTQNSENARLGWEKRRKKAELSDRNATASNSQSETNAIRGDKNREEERRKDIDRRKHSFAESIKPFVSIYGRDMCNRFYDYWSEPNKSKTKIKWEMEKTWDIEKRLKRWSEPKFKPIQTANF